MMLESNVWAENSFLFIHTTWIGNNLLKIRKMNRAELILKTAYSSAIALAAILKTRSARRVVSFPPSFARTFSSKERRLGTRQPVTHDSKKHPGSISGCSLLAVFLARRLLIISLSHDFLLGQNTPKKM